MLDNNRWHFYIDGKLEFIFFRPITLKTDEEIMDSFEADREWKWFKSHNDVKGFSWKRDKENKAFYITTTRVKSKQLSS